MKHHYIISTVILGILITSATMMGQNADSTLYSILSSRKLRLNGYSEIEYQQFQDPSKIDEFNIHRARLQLRGDLSNHMEYFIQTDFVPSNPLLLDATASYILDTALKFTAGQMKLNISQENLLDDSKLFTINRSQVVEAMVARSKDVIGNQNGRDIGIMASGSLISLPWYKFLDYSFALFNGQGINQADANSEKDFDGRLLIHPVKNLDMGGAVYTGYDKFGSVPANHIRDRYGFDLGYSYNRFDIRAEFIRGQDSTIHRQGYYIQAAYFILAKKLQVVGKYDNFDPNTNPKVTNDQTMVFTGALNYFFSSNLWIKLDYEKHDVQNNTSKNDLYLVELLIAF
jgi:phosphate-selective porin OprO/OprP